MAELKTKQNDGSVAAFLDSVPDQQRRADAKRVATMMAAITKTKPKMWGPSIVGYGTQHYKYATGREGDWFRTGFSPRKGSLTLYIMSGFNRHPDLMAKLGTYTTSVSCLYLKRLDDVDQVVLGELVTRSLDTPLPGADAAKKTATPSTPAGKKRAKRPAAKKPARSAKTRARARG